MDNRNEPTDMDLIGSPDEHQLLHLFRHVSRFYKPKPGCKMETFKVQAGASLNFEAMPDHHPDEPFYRRAVSELQELKKQLTWRQHFDFPKYDFPYLVDSNIEEITGSQNAIPVVTPKPPSATGPTPSGDQNPVSTLPPQSYA
ncbi:hypothetical protein TNCV_323671 [Trichonephila clavipes]|nr:hypothetical protein TNCV_323671 [Trichonephila clavipes]